MRLTNTDLAISVCMCGYSSNTSQEVRTFGQYVNLRENLFVTKKKRKKTWLFEGHWHKVTELAGTTEEQRLHPRRGITYQGRGRLWSCYDFLRD